MAYIAEAHIKAGLKEHGFVLLDAEDDAKENRKRQAEGLAAKKACGDWDDYGRPKKVIDNFDEYRRMVANGETSVTAVCKKLGISRSTWYERVKEVV